MAGTWGSIDLALLSMNYCVCCETLTFCIRLLSIYQLYVTPSQFSQAALNTTGSEMLIFLQLVSHLKQINVTFLQTLDLNIHTSKIQCVDQSSYLPRRKKLIISTYKSKTISTTMQLFCHITEQMSNICILMFSKIKNFIKCSLSTHEYTNYVEPYSIMQRL